MKKFLAIILIVTILLTLGGCSPSSPTDNSNTEQKFSGENKQAKTQYLTFAAPPSSSALYSFWVSIAKAVSSVYPEFKISVSESQGAIDITKRVRLGEANVGNSMSCTDYDNYNGKGTFEGSPNKNLRMLFYYETGIEMFLVSKESNITSLSDLEGKKFNPGGTGGTSAILCYDILDLLNIKPSYLEAGQADAADAYANRQVVGTVKLGPAGDSYVLQLDAANPVTIISMTDEEIDTILKAFPYLAKVVIPANTFSNITKDITTVATPSGAQASSALSQEDGYKIVKAILEDGKEIWQASYPSGANNDYIAMTLKSAVPLHAGTVQYLVEKGYDVPEKLIPPEYVPVK